MTPFQLSMSREVRPIESATISSNQPLLMIDVPFERKVLTNAKATPLTKNQKDSITILDLSTSN
jgi:hypothetical protein